MMGEPEEKRMGTPAPGGGPSLTEELKSFLQAMPDKPAYGFLLLCWIALFHFYGNSTLGYVDTSSLFGWMDYAYGSRADDEHGYYLPFVVILLVWWKREELLAVRKTVSASAVVLVLLALVTHVVGYQIQQTRISIVAFYFGLFALGGVVWGWRWLAGTFFPFFLFAFGVPLGNKGDAITQPLRQLATDITAAIAQGPLGIKVIQNGTTIFDPSGRFSYEIAAACSGLRSLTAITVVAVISAFVWFPSWWRRAVMIGAAVPLAIGSNVFRLLSIIVAAEAFGQDAGDFVHDNGLLSLLPYLPAFVGLGLLGWFVGGYWRPWIRRIRTTEGQKA
jgi:exosortase